MSNTYEIEKGKGCPEGMHAHDGSIHCHPADKPHKPNSKSDLAHRKLGLPNTWYEQHGTTMEEYDKENGQEGEKTEEGTQEGSEGTQEPTSEESTEQTPEEPSADPDRPLSSKVKWDAVKNFRRNNEEHFQKVEKARAEYERIKDDESMTGVEKFNSVMRIATDRDEDYNFVSVYNSTYINSAPKEVQDNLMDSILNAMEMNPLLASTYRYGIGIDTNVRSGVMMYYTPGLNQISVGIGELKKVDDTTEMSNVKDPVTKETTDWGFHFSNSTNINAICHESGHAVSSTCNALNHLAKADWHDEKNANNLMEEAGIKGVSAIFLDYEDNGEKTLRLNANYNMEDVEEFVKAKEVLEANGYTLIEREPERSDYDGELYPSYDVVLSAKAKKAKIDKAYEEWRTPKDIEQLKQKFGEDNAYVKMVEEQEERKDRSYDGFINQQVMDNGAHVISGKFGVDRIKECEAVYKKLYGVKKIIPSECYSAYGYYGESVWMYGQMKQKKLNALVADERFAEAYSDVIARGDQANSMSKLIVAHSYYELAQVQDGYEGTFEDYIKETMGDSLKERIIKMIRYTHNQFIASF